MDSKLAGRTALGVIWLVASRLSTRLIDFVTLLILAKLVTPADFGLVAIAASIVTIVDSMSELPVGQALLRLAEINEEHLHTAFSLGLIRGLIVAAVLAVLSVPLAHFFNDQRLVLLIIALSVAPLGRSLISPALTLYARDIDFTRDFIMEFLGKLVTLSLASSIAYEFHTYWAIAAATIVAPTMNVIMSYILAPTRVRLSMKEWRSFSGFLGWSTGAQLVSVVNWQSDRFMLGHFVPKALLGEFSIADTIASLPDQALIHSSTRPVLAAFGQVRDDREGLRKSYGYVSATITAVGLPAVVMVSALADPFVRLLLGAKWLGAIPILQWIILSNIPRLITSPLLPLAMTLNHTKVFLTRSLWELVAKLPLLFLSVMFFGIPGAIVTRLVVGMCNLVVEMLLVKKLSGLKIIHQLLPLWRIAAAGAVCAATVIAYRSLLVEDNSYIYTLTVTALICVLSLLVYMLTCLILWGLTGRVDDIEALWFRSAISQPLAGRRELFARFQLPWRN